jgi:hypothetical protein
VNAARLPDNLAVGPGFDIYSFSALTNILKANFEILVHSNRAIAASSVHTSPSATFALDLTPVARLQRAGFPPRRMLHRKPWQSWPRLSAAHPIIALIVSDWFGRWCGIRQGSKQAKLLSE